MKTQEDPGLFLELLGMVRALIWEPLEEPEGNAGGPERGKRARGNPPQGSFGPLVLLAPLLAFPWAPWNTFMGSTFKGVRLPAVRWLFY